VKLAADCQRRFHHDQRPARDTPMTVWHIEQVYV
jgi:hypothetical protein